jgi:hypothetical protein
MNNECPHCGALMFSGERSQQGSYGLCCNHGKVVLPSLEQPPARLLELFNSPRSGPYRHFWDNIRRYNSAISLGSINANVFSFNDGPPTYRVNGIMSHRIGPIHPETGQPARFLQVYFLGDSSMQPRDDYFTDLNPELIRELRGLQREYNVLLRNLMRVYDEIQTNDDNDNIQDVVLSIISPSAQLDRRTHNVPSRVEVAAFVPDGNYDNDHLNIRILSTGGEIRLLF